MRALNYVMSALFLFGAIVQFNDPDPLTWTAIYLAAAIVSFLATRRPANVIAPALIGVIAAIWAATLVGDAIVPFFGLFQEWEMRNEAVEVSREFYGLAVITFWMVVLVVRALLLRRGRGHQEARTA